LSFPNFQVQSKSISERQVHSAIAASFSTTTAAAKAAHEITLMSAMKNDFSYGCQTMCGIPNITLLGTQEDWVDLRMRAEKLGDLMMPEFSMYWLEFLLPVLDEFVESFKGNVKHGFWQSMIKLRHTGGGSGAYSFISGWIQILFPYLASGGLNQNLKPWNELFFYGPESDDFPIVASTAPGYWEHHGSPFDMTFHAGILGFSQDAGTGALSPLLGWYVSHEPPKSAKLQLRDAKQELLDLVLGHKDDIAADVIDKNAPWYRRIQRLQELISALNQEAAGM